jgi:hypothetical protein
MANRPDRQQLVTQLLRDPPEECRPVAELFRHSERGSPAERALGAAGRPFFVFCEQLGLEIFDADLQVGYDEVVPLDEEGEALLRLALLAHQEHPETIEDYAARLCWASHGRGPAGSAPA